MGVRVEMQKILTRSGRALLYGFAAFALICAVARGQDAYSPDDAPPPRETDYTLSFSKAFVQPGNEVSLMVLFAQKSGTGNVKRLRARFPFPGEVLSYVRMEDAYLSRRVKLQMKAAGSQAAGDEQMLEMNFEMPAGSDAAFPSGQIATLFFKVADPAPDQVIRINPEAWIDDQPILPDSQQAQVEYGLVKITQEPVIVGCFFFTH